MGRTLLDHQHTQCLSEAEISGYLAGNLASQATRRVEHHLLDCPLCSDAVEGFEAFPATVRLLENFSEFIKKLPLPEAGKVRQLTPARTLLRAAAAAAVLVVGYLAFFRAPSGDQLYSQFYTYYNSDLPLNRRGDAASVFNPAFESAMNAYQNRQFSECLPLFERALKLEPDNHAAHFFTGLTSLETQQWQRAADCFSKVKESGSGYARQAGWYLALAALKLGDQEKAKSLLDELIAAGGFKAEEARELRSKL